MALAFIFGLTFVGFIDEKKSKSCKSSQTIPKILLDTDDYIGLNPKEFDSRVAQKPH